MRWSGDGQRICFQWKQASDAVDHPMDTYVVNRDGIGLRKLTEEEARMAPPAFGNRTRDHLRMVYASEGDLFLYDFSTDTAPATNQDRGQRIESRNSRAMRSTSRSRAAAICTRCRSKTGMLEQMTEIAPARRQVSPAPTAGGGRGGRGGRGGGGEAPPPTAGTPPKGTDSQEFLKKQEKELIEIVRERAKLREENEARRKKDHPRKPFPASGAADREPAGVVSRWNLRHRDGERSGQWIEAAIMFRAT